MTLRPTPESGDASITIELPVPRDGRWSITPRIIRRGGPGKGTLALDVSLAPGGFGAGQKAASDPDQGSHNTPIVWTWNDQEGHDACADVGAREAALTVAAGARLVLSATGGKVTLDRVNLRWVKPPK
jgi:hypothetical protein